MVVQGVINKVQSEADELEFRHYRPHDQTAPCRQGSYGEIASQDVQHPIGRL